MWKVNDNGNKKGEEESQIEKGNSFSPFIITTEVRKRVRNHLGYISKDSAQTRCFFFLYFQIQIPIIVIFFFLSKMNNIFNYNETEILCLVHSPFLLYSLATLEIQ